MPRDSFGAYSLPAGNPVVTGTLITSEWGNTTMEDIEAALTSSLDRQGRGGMQAPLRLTDGSLSSPGLAWVADTRSGLLREAPGQWVMVADGQIIARVSDTGGLFVTQPHLDTKTGVWVMEQGSRVYSPNNPPPGGGETFLTLTDTPPSYTGFAGQSVVVKGDELGLEFGPGGPGGPGGPSLPGRPGLPGRPSFPKKVKKM